MKKFTVLWLSYAVLICAALAAGAQSAPHVPSRSEILALMHKVDDWQTAHPVMPPGDRGWERGTWYTGVVEAWKATRDEAFFNQALEWGKQNEWQVGAGKAGGNRLFCAETWVELYLAKRDPAMIEPTMLRLATAEPNSPAGAKRWYLDNKGQPYVDSLYGGSTLAVLAHATGKQEYLTILRAFFDDITGTLWDQESGLYYRDPSYIGQRTTNGKKVLWSRGNGWAFAALARILEYLPKNNPDRAKYLAIYRRMATELIKRQSPDGFWRVNLDDPEEFPNPESSGTGLFCYGLAWGINHHVLNRREFFPASEKAYAALTSAVGPEGKVEWGQLVDSKPHTVHLEDTHEYVTGAFLLAAGEIYRMSPKAAGQ